MWTIKTASNSAFVCSVQLISPFHAASFPKTWCVALALLRFLWVSKGTTGVRAQLCLNEHLKLELSLCKNQWERFSSYEPVIYFLSYIIRNLLSVILSGVKLLPFYLALCLHQPIYVCEKIQILVVCFISQYSPCCLSSGNGPGVTGSRALVCPESH